MEPLIPPEDVARTLRELHACTVTLDNGRVISAHTLLQLIIDQADGGPRAGRPWRFASNVESGVLGPLFRKLRELGCIDPPQG